MIVFGMSNSFLFQWDFRDGEGSDRFFFMYVFLQGGIYVVLLMVIDEVIGVVSALVIIEVKVVSDDVSVVVASAMFQQGIALLNVSLRGIVVGGNEFYMFSWNFGDGSDFVTL